MSKQAKWIELLLKFSSNLRIVSREVSVKPGERGAPLHLWESQKRILREIAEGMDDDIRKFYVLKSRQLGSTTVFVVLLLFWLAMHPKTKGALVVDQDKTRDDFRETIRFIIESIPAGYFGGAFGIEKGADNKYYMSFTNGSRVNFLVAGTSTSKEKWGESSGYSIVVLTEVASYGSERGLNNFEEAMSENNPDRLYVYESTAKGRNHWFQRWESASKDIYTTKRIFVGWWSKEINTIPRTNRKFAQFGQYPPDGREAEKIRLVRERYNHEVTMEQLAWYRWRQSDDSKTEADLDQNQPWLPEEAFVVSGKSYFQTRLVGRDMERVGEVLYKGYRFFMGRDIWSVALQELDPARDLRSEVELRVWNEPMPEGQYVIGCDPAGGSDEKNNNHSVSVWRCYADKIVQCAEYADNMTETRHCAWVLAYLAGAYRNCQIILELSGGYGKAVMVELDHIRDQLRADYNLEKRGGIHDKNPNGDNWQDFLSNASWYIYRRPDSPTSNGYILNWITTNENKNLIFSEFRDSHINGSLMINSRPLLDEMLNVVQDRSSIGAPGQQKDDRVFAACLANHAWVQSYRPGMISQGLTYEAVTAEESKEGSNGLGTLVRRIVAEHFRRYEEGVPEVSPRDRWEVERGL